jgi:hypothetical protein
MSKPGADPSSGISLGDALRLPKRHPACRRREAQSKTHLLRPCRKLPAVPRSRFDMLMPWPRVSPLPRYNAGNPAAWCKAICRSASRPGPTIYQNASHMAQWRLLARRAGDPVGRYSRGTFRERGRSIDGRADSGRSQAGARSIGIGQSTAVRRPMRAAEMPMRLAVG